MCIMYIIIYIMYIIQWNYIQYFNISTIYNNSVELLTLLIKFCLQL